MKYRLSDDAMEDLAAIWRFVASDNVSAADRLLSALIDRIELVAESPGIGSRCPRLGRGVRRISLGNYLIFYTRSRTRIDIARVLHGARNWEELL